MIASCGFLENELSQFSKEEGITLADGVETFRVDLRTRFKRLGAKEKARRKKCKVRFSIIKKNKAFRKNYTKVGVDLGSPCGWDVSHGEIKIEETDGGSCGQQEHDLLFFVYGNIRP